MIVTTSLSRRGLVRAGGGLLLTGILPIDDNVSDWGRSLQGRGADRFERAQEFYQGVAAGLYRDPRDLLYQAGIVAQLGIGAYLLDLGASDDWCRQRIGLFVDGGLATKMMNGCGKEMVVRAIKFIAVRPGVEELKVLNAYFKIEVTSSSIPAD